MCRAARRAASEEGIKESSPETSGDGMVGFIPLAGAATTSRRARGPQTARRCLPTSGRGIQTATPEELCVQCRGVRRSFAPVAVPRPAPSSCRPAAGVDTFRPPMTSPRRCLFVRPQSKAYKRSPACRRIQAPAQLDAAAFSSSFGFIYSMNGTAANYQRRERRWLAETAHPPAECRRLAPRLLRPSHTFSLPHVGISPVLHPS